MNTNPFKKKVFCKLGLTRARMQRVAGLLCLLALIFFVSPATIHSQLCQPASFYDSMSWTWSYAGPCSTIYNCLSYALGITTSWTWPWGSSNPTPSQVNSYLSTKGYYTSGYNPKIISYGPTSSYITHFSKVTGSSTCTAKWGSLNLLDHGSWDPYYPSSSYGSKRTVYYGTRYPQVSISGPTNLEGAGFYQWCADVLYGTPPYTYYWEYSSPQTRSYCMGVDECVEKIGIFDEDGYIDVVVTDALGYHAFASIYVTVGLGGGGMEYMASDLESLSDKELIANNISALLDGAAAKGIYSANPYDYIDSEYFRNIVKMGPRSLMTIRKMILTSQENGLKEYILAIASEEIARINLKGNNFAWADAKEYCRKWDNYMKTLPKVVADILASDQPMKSKNKALVKLGIPVIPFLVDEINRGNNKLDNALNSLLSKDTSLQKRNAGESLKDWEKKNSEALEILKKLNEAYKQSLF